MDDESSVDTARAAGTPSISDSAVLLNVIHTYQQKKTEYLKREAECKQTCENLQRLETELQERIKENEELERKWVNSEKNCDILLHRSSEIQARCEELTSKKEKTELNLVKFIGMYQDMKTRQSTNDEECQKVREERKEVSAKIRERDRYIRRFLDVIHEISVLGLELPSTTKCTLEELQAIGAAFFYSKPLETDDDCAAAVERMLATRPFASKSKETIKKQPSMRVRAKSSGASLPKVSPMERDRLFSEQIKKKLDSAAATSSEEQTSGNVGSSMVDTIHGRKTSTTREVQEAMIKRSTVKETVARLKNNVKLNFLANPVATTTPEDPAATTTPENPAAPTTPEETASQPIDHTHTAFEYADASDLGDLVIAEDTEQRMESDDTQLVVEPSGPTSGSDVAKVDLKGKDERPASGTNRTNRTRSKSVHAVKIVQKSPAPVRYPRRSSSRLRTGHDDPQIIRIPKPSERASRRPQRSRTTDLTPTLPQKRRR